MGGNGSLDQHRSAGFHRRVCVLMPEALVREALTATRDAVERSRGGEGRLSKGPGAYFAGAVKKLAEDHGIDLGLKGTEPRSGKAAEPPQRPVSARFSSRPPPDTDESRVDAEEARRAIGELMAKLDAERA